MAGTASRLIGVTSLLVVFLTGVSGPAHAGDSPLVGCWTVGTTEPDGVDRYVTVCFPPQR